MENQLIGDQIFRGGRSLDSLAAPGRGRREFPLRALMICFTAWLIATEVLIFDHAKFNARAELLDEAARALRGRQLIVPGECPLNPSSKAKTQRL